MATRLGLDFYGRKDVVGLSRELLGKVLVSDIEGQLVRGVIVETEAYNGEVDKACHAYGGRRTSRTEVMYAQGGTAYVYLCYGIHHLLNVVTNDEGIPEAILVRGIVPLEGKEIMIRRRGIKKVGRDFCIGPGKVSQALGIVTGDTGESLMGERIWIEDRGIEVEGKMVEVGPRIGIDYAEEDALLPYRFQVKSEYYNQLIK